MNRSRFQITSLVNAATTIAILLQSVGGPLAAQQPTLEQLQVQLEKQYEATPTNSQPQSTPEAIASLKAAVKRNKNDLGAWHKLGNALEQSSNIKEAVKAHEKAARLGDKLLSEQLDGPGAHSGFSERLQPIRTALAEAAESAQKYLRLSPKRSEKKAQEWQLRADSLQAFSEIANASPGTPSIYTGKEVSVKARVISKPEPSYTEEARQKQVTGTIVLRAIFAANGQVVGIRAVSGLPNGLTQQAINAARRIKFIPAVKDGRPVSMYIQLEYNFNLY